MVETAEATVRFPSRCHGDFDTALVHNRCAVELQPENATYHFLLGDVLARVGEIGHLLQRC